MTLRLLLLFEQQMHITLMIESAITSVIFVVWKYVRILSSFLWYLLINPRTFHNHFPFSGTQLFLLRISCSVSFASVLEPVIRVANRPRFGFYSQLPTEAYWSGK